MELQLLTHSNMFATRIMSVNRLQGDSRSVVFKALCILYYTYSCLIEV